MNYTRQQAIDIFSVEYCRQYSLAIPVRAVKGIIENKLIETHNAYYLSGTVLKLHK